jgi:hypothetical protein
MKSNLEQQGMLIYSKLKPLVCRNTITMIFSFNNFKKMFQFVYNGTYLYTYTGTQFTLTN